MYVLVAKKIFSTGKGVSKNPDSFSNCHPTCRIAGVCRILTESYYLIQGASVELGVQQNIHKNEQPMAKSSHL